MNCFDFDKTIYKKDSAISFYMFYLKKYPFRIFGVFRMVVLFILNCIGFINTKQFKEKYFAFIKNIKDIDSFVAEFWQKEKGKMINSVVANIKDGDVVISASPLFLVEPAIKMINEKIVVFATDMDKTTGLINGENMKGKEKLKLLNEKGYTSFDAVYTDSLSDFPILDMATNKYIVCGEKYYEFGKQKPTLGTKIKYIIKQLRVKHYVKNGLIFLPLFFSGFLTDWGYIVRAIWGFVSFCLSASFVYVVNDLVDAKKDRNHSTKRKRPIASYMVKPYEAILLAMFLLVSNCCILTFVFNFEFAVVSLVFGYIILNIMYSMWLKKIPILDVFLLASFYVIRVFFGALILWTGVSKWLYLTIICASLYMGFGKRRNEIKKEGDDTRGVNKHYNFAFLDKNMYLCLTMCLIFYALWVVEFRIITVEYYNSILLLATIPIMFFIMMKYSLNIENPSNSGDPIDVLLKDKVLIFMCLLFVAMVVVSVYVPVSKLFRW